MARLLTNGFELQSLFAAGEDFTQYGSGTACAVSTTTYRSGAAAMRATSFTSGQASGVTMLLANSAASGPFYARVYFRFATAPSANNTIIALGDSANLRAYLKFKSTSKLGLYELGDTQRGSDSATLSAGTWYRLEFMAQRVSDGSDVIVARIDGTDFGSSTGSAIGGTMDRLILGGNLQSEAQTTGDWFYDDVAVNDGSASGKGHWDQLWPGPGKIVNIWPNEHGDYEMGESGPTTGLHAWEMMDESPTPNDATDYWELQAGSDICDCTMNSATSAGIAATDRVLLVAGNARVCGESAVSCNYNLRLKSRLGTTITGASGGRTIASTTWSTNDDGAVHKNHPAIANYDMAESDSATTPWSAELVDSMQLGITTSDANPDIWISTIWAQVEYDPDQVTRCFMTGFETGDAAECHSVSGTSYEFSSTYTEDSAYSLRINPTLATTTYVFLTANHQSGASNYVRLETSYVKFDFRVDTLPASGSEEICAFRDITDGRKAGLRVTSGGKIQIYAYDGTTQIGSDSTQTLVVNTWYRIEFQCGTGTSAAAAVKIDGSDACSGTGNVGQYNADGIWLGKITNRSSQSVDYYYDNVVCSNATWPGASAIRAMQPSADGYHTGWTLYNAPSKWEAVQEIPYDDTDYVYTTTSGAQYTAALESASSAGIAANATIRSVKLLGRVASASTSGCTFHWLLRGQSYTRESASNYNISSTTPVWLGYVMTECPGTGAQWVYDDLDGLEVGMEANTTIEHRLFAAYAMVEYTGGSLSGTAAISTATVDGLAPTATGSGTGTGTAALSTGTVAGLAPTATGSATATATAALATATADSLAATGQPTGAAPANADLAAVAGDALAGSGTGTGAAQPDAQLGPATITALAPSGIGAGTVTATANLSACAVAALEASGQGAGAAIHAVTIATATADSLEATATAGVASRVADLATATVETLEAAGTGVGSSVVAADLGQCTIAGLEASGLATGAAIMTASLATATSEALGGSAMSGGASRTAEIAPATVDSLAVSGQGIGTATATGVLATGQAEGLGVTGQGIGTGTATAALGDVTGAALAPTGQYGNQYPVVAIAGVSVASLEAVGLGTGTQIGTVSLSMATADGLGVTGQGLGTGAGTVGIAPITAAALATTTTMGVSQVYPAIAAVSTDSLAAGASGTGAVIQSAALAPVTTAAIDSQATGSGTAAAAAALATATAIALEITKTLGAAPANATLAVITAEALAPGAQGQGITSQSVAIIAISVEGLEASAVSGSIYLAAVCASVSELTGNLRVYVPSTNTIWTVPEHPSLWEIIAHGTRWTID